MPFILHNLGKVLGKDYRHLFILHRAIKKSSLCTRAYVPAKMNALNAPMILLWFACSCICVQAACVTPKEVRIATWDGSLVPVCDTHMCDDELRHMSSTTPIKPLVTRFGLNFESYVTNLDRIEGWMHPIHVTMVGNLTSQQWSVGVTGVLLLWCAFIIVYTGTHRCTLVHIDAFDTATSSAAGSVGEIGVYKGKFLLAIAGHASPDEPVMACDLFSNKTNPGMCCCVVCVDVLCNNGAPPGPTELQYDSSKAVVEQAIAKYLKYNNNITFLDMDSTTLTTSKLAHHHLPAFRMLSVDGGHTLEITLHDLNLAACAVADGGIVIMDDINNLQWAGVSLAANLFSVLQDNLVPFLRLQNKLYFTTPSHHQLYLNFVHTQAPDITCFNFDQNMHASRVSWGQWRVCHANPKAQAQ